MTLTRRVIHQSYMGFPTDTRDWGATRPWKSGSQGNGDAVTSPQTFNETGLFRIWWDTIGNNLIGGFHMNVVIILYKYYTILHYIYVIYHCYITLNNHTRIISVDVIDVCPFDQNLTHRLVIDNALELELFLGAQFWQTYLSHDIMHHYCWSITKAKSANMIFSSATPFQLIFTKIFKIFF